VIVDHGGGVFTLYCHLSEFSVAEGVDVAAGHQLGLVGNTGLSTGPHLHWELRVQGVRVDPVRRLVQ
jgi:murein DD-endopeptidase MepM/ murein hydrolase activator NlpD